MPTEIAASERSLELARQLLQDCGLTRDQLLRIPRRPIFTDLQVGRIMAGRDPYTGERLNRIGRLTDDLGA